VAFGAVLGKVSPIQLLIMTLFQVTLFAINEFILLNLLEVSGGSEGGGDTGRDSRWLAKERAGDTHQPGKSLDFLSLSFVISKVSGTIYPANMRAYLVDQVFLEILSLSVFIVHQLGGVGCSYTYSYTHTHTPHIPRLFCPEKVR
jgi:hypothetical protein